MMELNDDQLPTAHLFHDTVFSMIPKHIIAADDRLISGVNIHFYGIEANISKLKQTR